MAISRSSSYTSLLFTPGERIGWIYRRNALVRRQFTEPPPNQDNPPWQLSEKANPMGGSMLSLLLGSVLFLMCGGYVNAILLGFTDINMRYAAIVTILITVGVFIRWVRTRRRNNRIYRTAEASFQEELAAWNERRNAFEYAESERLRRAPEWSAVDLGSRIKRFDVVGGTLWGWEALITVHGAALLATRGPLTVLDFSYEAVSRELLRISPSNGYSVDALLLPHQLDQCDMLIDLSDNELIDSLVESIHAQEPAESRLDRALDHRILTKICGALEGRVTIRRIVAALQELMGQSSDLFALTPQEEQRITGDLFSQEYRQQSYPRLQALESYLHPLIGLGEQKHKRPAAPLTCLAMATDGQNSLRGELLTDLIVQQLIRRIADGTDGMSSLMIAGADKIPLKHLEKLSDLCGRRDIRLVLLHRHLRGTAAQGLGGGTVGFMRLGNHEQAAEAANFIGTQEKFVLSEVNAKLGGNDTHSFDESEDYGQAAGGQTGTSFGVGVTGLFGKPSAGMSWSRSESKTWNVTRNWRITRGKAEGMNWSRSVSAQRVREYAVEPQQLQELPEYALLLVADRTKAEPVVAVECNPDLISLPRVSMSSQSVDDSPYTTT